MARLEHIGIAVDSAAAVADLYHALLELDVYKRERVEREGVETHFMRAGGTKLELLEATGPESPIARHLERRGAGLHHLAFQVADVDAALARAVELGFQPLADAPRPGADGKRIVFLHPRGTHGVLVELCGDARLPMQRLEAPWRDGALVVHDTGGGTRDGDDVPLLLLHGAGGSTEAEMMPLARRLEPHRRVLALDLPGHGASAPGETPWTPAALAEAVCAALDAADVRRADLLGYSMGGYAALAVGRHAPQRARRIVIHETGFFWSSELAERLAAHFDARAEPGADAAFDARHEHPQALASALAGFLRRLPRSGMSRSDLSLLPHPVLVSAGDAGRVFPLADTLDVRSAIRDADLALWPATGHALGALDLDAFVPLVLGWLEREA